MINDAHAGLGGTQSLEHWFCNMEGMQDTKDSNHIFPVQNQLYWKLIMECKQW